ncbi:MAG: insulinase family protein [Flavobacteriales bacterium]|nr:insulinase family protein [Flavobacteriales bacterium]
MEYKIHTFENGLRLVFKQSYNTQIAHCGYFINAGSRDETEDQIGLAHLLEHMLFKGTKKRNTNQVLNRLEVVGGDMNAFTTKDKTVIHASVVKDHFNRAIELLTDVTFNSSFPEKELEKEKKVIYEEIEMYLDSPDERIFDEFQELFYPNHPLGNNILGSKDTVSSFSSKDLSKFISQRYFSNEILLVVVAPISFDKAVKVCEKHLSLLEIPLGKINREPPTDFKTFDKIDENGFGQAHTLIGCNAYPLNHPNRPALMLLSNILGGPGLNSILNLKLREKHAYTYGVDCGYQALTDSGFLTIYFGTDKRNVNRARKAVLKELEHLRNTTMKESLLKKYKTQFKGQLIMAEESNSSMMFVIGRSLLDLGFVDSLATVIENIDQITADQLRLVANELFAPEKLNFLTYLPKSN